MKNSGPTVLDASIKMALKFFEAYNRYNQRNRELYTLAAKLEESNEEMISTEEELRRREASLAESDNRFRSVLKLVPDMISIHDPDMNILYSNWRGFAEVPESKRRIHTKCYKTYRILDYICPDCLAKTVLKTGKPLRKETELPEGMWVDIRAIPVLDVGIGERGVLTQSQGFGLRIVKMPAEQLEGSFTITDNNGTRSVLKFEV